MNKYEVIMMAILLFFFVGLPIVAGTIVAVLQ